MYVHMRKEKTVVLDKINSRTFPAGWQGEVPAEYLANWDEKDFDVIAVPGAVKAAGGIPAAALTSEQVSVLATAANEALAHAHGIIDDQAADADDADPAVDKSEGVKA